MASPRNKRFLAAVRSGNLENVKVELQAGANPNYQNGYPIIFTSEFGGILEFDELMRVLLEAGANPKQLDPNGVPVLAYAGKGRSNEMVEMLLKAGADPNVSYNGYQSVLDGVLERSRVSRRIDYYPGIIKLLCEVTNYDEVERLKQKYPQYANLLNCQESKATISKNMAVVETALDNAAIRTYPQQTPDGVELPHVMKNIKEYAYKNVGPGGRRKTKKRKSGKKKTKKRK